MLFLRGYTLKRVVIKSGKEQQNKDIEAQTPGEPAGEVATGTTGVSETVARDDERTIRSSPSVENEKSSVA